MRERLPEYLKKGIIDTDKTKKIRNILKRKGLNTVCDAARCPNKSECYAQNTATFLALGSICTRNCRFCSVVSGVPECVDSKEPQLIKEATEEMGLKYVVITMVTRDDLDDGGASHIKKIVETIKSLKESPRVEVLISDLRGNISALENLLDSPLDVLNHNIETVPALYPKIRSGADYVRSLNILEKAKSISSGIKTKTGLMFGLGEETPELVKVFADLNSVGCDILTAGQYIQPTKNHAKVFKFLSPQEFTYLENLAKKEGIKYTAFAPLVRSSYKAKELFFLR